MNLLALNQNTTLPSSQRLPLFITTGLLLLGYCIIIYSGLAQGLVANWVTDGAWTLASLAAGLRCSITAQRVSIRHEKVAWMYFALAAFSWFVGMLAWDYYELVLRIPYPYPGVGDIFFMGFAPLFVLGTFYYRVYAPTGHFTLIQIGNLGIIFCTIVVISLIVLFQPIQQSNQGTVFVSFALSHSILYLLAFCFALFCYWFYVWESNRRSFLLMLIALFIHAVADTLYTFELLGHSFSAFNYLNVYWLVAFALQYWSAWEQDNKNSIRQHADKIDNSAPRLMAAYEALMPALCIVVIVVTGIGYHDRVTSTLVLIAGPPLVAFACFLGLREWYTHKVESSLHQAVYEANKTLEQRVHERTHALKTSNMELESFCYSVSHDLRTPLRAINGYASALREDYQHTFDKDGRNYLARIREASIRMGELIDSMLQLSRLSRQQLCREQIDLTQLSNKTVQQLQQQNPDHKMDVSIQDNLQTHGDPALVAILFDNLFGNAWKYTGKIPNPKVEFGCHHNGTGAVYYVRDNGVGFDMRYVDKLFKPFQRLHRDTEFPGYGIGLATVSRIIRLHGGEVWAESSAGEGTTISFTLEPSPSRSEQQFVQMSE